MGDVLTVLEGQSEDHFLLLNLYTGERTTVTIDPDKKSLFTKADPITGACPFLRHSFQTGLAYCTVHLTRPDMCKDFGCWRLLVLDSSGHRAGRVMQQRFFAPDNEKLALLWEGMISELDEPDIEHWDEMIMKILSREGYRVVR
jgi:Fe-S-cluster containining protein